jgi:acyl transferase domain-containing protein
MGPPSVSPAFLYGSQGAVAGADFGRRLLDADPVFAATFDRADHVIRARLGWSLVAAPRSDGPLESLASDPAAVQPLQTAMRIAITAAVRARHIEPDADARL